MKTHCSALICILFWLKIIDADNPEIDIHMEEKTGDINYTNWLQMICFSNTNTLGCTSEFLMNQKSYDQIRGEENLCYHSGGLCTHRLCTCSSDCKQFTMNFTSLPDIPNITFGCNLKVKVNKVTFKATIQLQLSEQGFTIINKKITKINGSGSNQDKTTQTPELDISSKTYTNVIVVCVALICIVSILSLIVNVCKYQARIENKYTLSGISMISNGSSGRIKVDSEATSGNNGSHSILSSEHHKLDSAGKTDQKHRPKCDAYSKKRQATSGNNGSHSILSSEHHKLDSTATRGVTGFFPSVRSRQYEVNSAGLISLNSYSGSSRESLAFIDKQSEAAGWRRSPCSKKEKLIQ